MEDPMLGKIKATINSFSNRQDGTLDISVVTDDGSYEGTIDIAENDRNGEAGWLDTLEAGEKIQIELNEENEIIAVYPLVE